MNFRMTQFTQIDFGLLDAKKLASYPLRYLRTMVNAQATLTVNAK